MSSHRAGFFGYWAEKNDYGLWLRGKLRKHPSRVGFMTGRVLVQLVNEQGRVIEEVNASLRKRSVKSRYVSFGADLTGKLQEIAVIRLIHDIDDNRISTTASTVISGLRHSASSTTAY